MGRDELLKQKKEYDEAMKEVKLKYSEPADIKYELHDESGSSAGYVEYRARNDTVILSSGGSEAEFSGAVLRSMRGALNKILDE
jgi:hypothetical protein